MAILFNVPRTAQSNDFRQKGPTCWYYAAKMLVSLHQMRLQPQFETQWKELHELRSVLSELSDDSEIPDNGYQDLTWIRGRLANASRFLGQVADYDHSPVGWYTQHRKKVALTLVRREYPGISEQKARNRSLYARNAHQHLMTEDAEGLDRFFILNTFVPDTFVQQEIQADTITKEFVEGYLREHGPFYASGNVWSRSANRRERSGHSDLVPADQRVEVQQLEPDSAHAVVVAGVLGDQLWYKDPNNSSEVRFIDFDKFKTGWTRAGTCRIIRAICPNRNATYNTRGGCQHTANVILRDA